MNSLFIPTKTFISASLKKRFRIATVRIIIVVGLSVLGLSGLMAWSSIDLSKALARERLQADAFRVNLLASEHLDRLQFALLATSSAEKLLALMSESNTKLPFVKEILLKDASTSIWPIPAGQDSPFMEEKWRFTKLVILEQLATSQQNLVISLPQETVNGDAEIILGWIPNWEGANEPVFLRVSLLTLLNLAAGELESERELRIKQVRVPTLPSFQNTKIQLAPEAKGNWVNLVLATSILNAEAQHITSQTETLTNFQDTITPIIGGILSVTALFLCLKLYQEVKAREEAELKIRAQEARVQKSAALATLGEISTLVSHEINQPLAAIEVFSSTCLIKLSQGPAKDHPDTPALTKTHHSIKHEVDRIKKIIGSIRGLASREGSKVRCANVAAVLEQIQPLIELQAKQFSARVDISADKAAVVAFDPAALEQILLNLVRNGLEAMSTTAGRKTLQVIADIQNEDLVSIRVIDQGPGIAVHLQDQIFSPFFSTKETGVGVGLSLCRSLVEKFGGRIWFETAENHGTVFHLSIPRVLPNQA